MGASFQALLEAKRRVKELEAEVAKLKGRLEPPKPPQIKDVISWSEVLQLYCAIFPEQADRIFVADSEYEITAISEIRRFIDWDDVNIFPYTSEYHDCDDFALALAGDFAKYPGWSGFPVTFIWGDYLDGHAFSTCVAWKSFKERIPTVYFIEPQNDHEIAMESVEGMELWLLPMRRVKRYIEHWD